MAGDVKPSRLTLLSFFHRIMSVSFFIATYLCFVLGFAVLKGFVPKHYSKIIIYMRH